MRAVAQFTITNINDTTPSASAPKNPYLGQSWTDTGASPPVMKIWDGTKWVDKTSELEEVVTQHTETLSSHDAKITANDTEIRLRVTQQEYKTNKTFVDGKLTALDSSLTEAESNIAILQGQIALKVEKKDITKALEGYSTTTQMKSAIELSEKGILSSVSETYSTKSDLSGVESRVSTAESTIKQNANDITLQVTETEALKTRTSTLEVTAEGFRADISDAAKTATNFLKFSGNGLVIGDQTKGTIGNNVLIDSDSVDIRMGDTVLASYSADRVYLGKNSKNSVIDLCSGMGTIKANRIIDDYNSLAIDSNNIYLNSEWEETGAYSAIEVTSYSPWDSEDTLGYITLSSKDGPIDRVTTNGSLIRITPLHTSISSSYNEAGKYYMSGIDLSQGELWLYADNLVDIKSYTNISINSDEETSITADFGSVHIRSGLASSPKSYITVHEDGHVYAKGVLSVDGNIYTNSNLGNAYWSIGQNVVFDNGTIYTALLNGTNSNGDVMVCRKNNAGAYSWPVIIRNTGEASFGGTVTGSVVNSNGNMNIKGQSVYTQYGGGIKTTTTFGDVGIVTMSSGIGLYLYTFKTGGSGWASAVCLADANGVNIVPKTGGTFTGDIATNGGLVVSGRIASAGTYNATGTAAANVCISNTNHLYRSTSSSRRYKHDIEDIKGDLDPRKILKIPVRQYIYNLDYLDPEDQRYNTLVPGFVAEEVEKYYPIAAEHANGQVEDWNARMMIPPMLAIEQEHDIRIARTEDDIEDLKKKYVEALSRIVNLETQNSIMQQQINLMGAA